MDLLLQTPPLLYATALVLGLPPLLLAMAVLIAITSPRRFNSGPPLLPGLMAASVWKKF